MKNCIKILAGGLFAALFSFCILSCDSGTENLFPEQSIPNLTNSEKESIFDAVLAGKNAEMLLAKLTDEQKADLLDKLLSDEKKNDIFGELLSDEKKNEIFDELLTEEKKNEIYGEKLTPAEKEKIFDEIFNDKRTNSKVIELLNDKEKAAVFDALLEAKTSKDFIVGILTKEENKTLYAEIKVYITDSLTKEELVALLDETDKTAPGEVSNLVAISKANAVQLVWTDGENLDNDLYGYLVSWKTASASRSIVALEQDTMLVAKSSKDDKSNGVTVADLKGGTNYCFTVQAIDLIGNKSTGTSVEAIPEGPSYSAKVSETENYTVYHLQQNTTGEKNAGDYDLFEKEEKEVAVNSSLDDLKKVYAGFTAKTMAQNEKSIYVFYDRNLITYTFKTGENGVFGDGTKEKKISGLYGSIWRIEKPEYIGSSESDEKKFQRWTSGDEVVEIKFGAESRTFEAEWAEYIKEAPEGFVFVKGFPIMGNETWEPQSGVFVTGKSLEIPDLIVCDHEVTKSEYKKFMGDFSYKSSCYDKDGNLHAYDKDENGNLIVNDVFLNNPANGVSWYKAIIYCNKRSIAEGLTPCYSVEGISDWSALDHNSYLSDINKWDAATCNFEANGYRLPTEAEWEWFARGGDDQTIYAGSNDVEKVAWYNSNSNTDTVKGTREVKQLLPNGYGLYDVSGNVMEWCWDAVDYNGVLNRIRRGGSWEWEKECCQVNARFINEPKNKNSSAGFRVVRTVK